MRQVHGVDGARGDRCRPTRHPSDPPEADAAVTAVRGSRARGRHGRLRAARRRVRRRGGCRARRSPRPGRGSDRGDDRRAARHRATARCDAYPRSVHPARAVRVRRGRSRPVSSRASARRSQVARATVGPRSTSPPRSGSCSHAKASSASTTAGVCTAGSDEYFSYRRADETGRQATIAVLPMTRRRATRRGARAHRGGGAARPVASPDAVAARRGQQGGRRSTTCGAAIACGAVDLGENRAQELVRRGRGARPRRPAPSACGGTSSVGCSATRCVPIAPLRRAVAVGRSRRARGRGRAARARRPRCWCR